ncbi:MAG: DUF433 domain-containing protein [Chloroflexi bacterium]|nr:DUF433 domain-containing protein [Chloroflexota bacterium]MCI0576868.1 DUF433 domain-containing protein [Chloroflexota bacterium]MCI0646478.1 DUF433 domain-containing protein [Chloroflexota bacterium]MCI0726170.1 DUF433 domain-containing protein [Chloroflexota bacterium]
MAIANTLEGLIVKRPELRGGRPIIAGTGVTVRTIVGHYKLGLTPEEIADEMSLELAGVYAALHTEYLSEGQSHAGIIVSDQLQVGLILRRLLKLLDARSAADMQNRLEFLSNWK